jgi:ribosome-associated protein
MLNPYNFIFSMNKDDEKSRTRLKKEAIALQQIGERLIGLSGDQLRRMDLPKELAEAIEAFRGMTSHGARRRQLQYIGAIMRAIDVAPIERALWEIEQGAYQQAQAFHRLESWRDRLVAGDDGLMEEILKAYPRADRQRLGQLVRNARKKTTGKAVPKSTRNLFRYLKTLSEP